MAYWIMDVFGQHPIDTDSDDAAIEMAKRMVLADVAGPKPYLLFRDDGKILWERERGGNITSQ
jgi:hypothetical protein